MDGDEEAVIEPVEKSPREPTEGQPEISVTVSGHTSPGEPASTSDAVPAALVAGAALEAGHAAQETAKTASDLLQSAVEDLQRRLLALEQQQQATQVATAVIATAVAAEAAEVESEPEEAEPEEPEEVTAEPIELTEGDGDGKRDDTGAGEGDGGEVGGGADGEETGEGRGGTSNPTRYAGRFKRGRR